MDTVCLGVSSEKGILIGRPSKYLLESRAQAMKLVRANGESVAEVARDLSINNTTLGAGPTLDGPSAVSPTALAYRL